ncbi:MAG TPA: hypothetical protein VGJ91_01775 [Polyangiaceae bacterium]|jgi:hypothetical protein
MNAFIFVRLAHVISAVFAGGLVASVAIVATRSTLGNSPTSSGLLRLTRWASLGLAATFLSGMGLDLTMGGALHQRLWFRLAGLSLIVVGALVGFVRRRLNQVASGAIGPSALRPIPWLAYAACAGVLWITTLMELKPF